MVLLDKYKSRSIVSFMNFNCGLAELEFDTETFIFHCKTAMYWNGLICNSSSLTKVPEIEATNFWKAMYWLHDNADKLKQAYEACAVHETQPQIVVAPYSTTIDGKPVDNTLYYLKAEYEFLDPVFQLAHPINDTIATLMDMSKEVARFYYDNYKLIAYHYIPVIDDRYQEAINALKPNHNYKY